MLFRSSADALADVGGRSSRILTGPFPFFGTALAGAGALEDADGAGSESVDLGGGSDRNGDGLVSAATGATAGAGAACGVSSESDASLSELYERPSIATKSLQKDQRPSAPLRVGSRLHLVCPPSYLPSDPRLASYSPRERSRPATAPHKPHFLTDNMVRFARYAQPHSGALECSHLPP